MFRRVLVLVVALSPGIASAASKEIQELQRDVAQLQDMVRTLQRNQDEKFAALQALVQQSVNSANDASRAVAVIQDKFQQNLRDQQEKVVAPVVGLGARMDQMSNDLRTVSQAVSDLTGLISKMQVQLTDLNNAVKVIQTPAPPPPGTTGQGGSATMAMPSGTTPGMTPGITPGGAPDAPTMPASNLYDTALRDYNGGKYDLAAQEFSQYLKWYGNTDFAPNAQFYIAEIHAAQGEFETAIREYDQVLEHYPANNKTPDAMYRKGMTLIKVGRRTDGAKELQDLARKYPRSSLVPRACEQVKSMGITSCGPRAAATKGGTKRKKS